MRNIKTIIRYGLLLSAVIFLCMACSEDNGIGKGMNEEPGYLRVIATIEDAALAQTRGNGTEEEVKAPHYDKANVPMDELYSYLPTSQHGGFVKGCKIGLYSTYGPDGPDDPNKLINIPLTHRGGGNNFESTEIQISSISNLGHTFAYYPYSETNDVNGADYDDEKYPINIYAVGKEDEESNAETYLGENNKVVDLLWGINDGTIGEGGSFVFSMEHACTMLIIYRGKGFKDISNDESEKDEVTVKLKKKINVFTQKVGGNNWKLVPEASTEDVAEDDLLFPTNMCESYTLPGSKDEPSPVYSVILPPGAEIDYIRMKDNFGEWQYVKPKEGQTVYNALEGGWRYPVTVQLDGLEPTIYPHDITKWDENDVYIKNEAAGIYDANGLVAWMKEMAKDEPSEDELAKYGKKSPGGGWIFYINDNIDCSSLSSTTPIQSLLTDFEATLDGRGRTLSNLTLQKTDDGGDNIGLFGNLKGCVTNLKINNITIKGGTSENECIGTIAGVIAGGEVTSCKVTGINLTGNVGHVGALAGNAQSGTVNKCTFEGKLFLGSGVKIDETESVRHLFGKIQEGFNLQNFNTEKVFILQSNIIEGN